MPKSAEATATVIRLGGRMGYKREIKSVPVEPNSNQLPIIYGVMKIS